MKDIKDFVIRNKAVSYPVLSVLGASLIVNHYKKFRAHIPEELCDSFKIRSTLLQSEEVGRLKLFSNINYNLRLNLHNFEKINKDGFIVIPGSVQISFNFETKNVSTNLIPDYAFIDYDSSGKLKLSVLNNKPFDIKFKNSRIYLPLSQLRQNERNVLVFKFESKVRIKLEQGFNDINQFDNFTLITDQEKSFLALQSTERLETVFPCLMQEGLKPLDFILSLSHSDAYTFLSSGLVLKEKSDETPSQIHDNFHFSNYQVTSFESVCQPLNQLRFIGYKNSLYSQSPDLDGASVITESYISNSFKDHIGISKETELLISDIQELILSLYQTIIKAFSSVQPLQKIKLFIVDYLSQYQGTFDGVYPDNRHLLNFSTLGLIVIDSSFLKQLTNTNQLLELLSTISRHL